MVGLLACGGLFVGVVILGLIGNAVAPPKDSTAPTTATPNLPAAPDDAAEETTTTEAPATTTTIPDQPFAGNGDQVITLPAGLTDARLAVITYQGGRNFVVKALGSSGRDDLLVNTIGAYSGTVIVNLTGAGAGVDGFEVGASGPWTLTLRDLSSARRLPAESGGRIDGTGDDAVVFTADGRTPLAISCGACSSNFVVRAIGKRANLLVNEIGAYDGTVLAPAETVMLEVNATGAWSITVQ